MIVLQKHVGTPECRVRLVVRNCIPFKVITVKLGAYLGQTVGSTQVSEIKTRLLVNSTNLGIAYVLNV